MNSRRNIHSKARRLREWVWWAIGFFKPICWVCGEEMENDVICAGDASDGWLLHHLYGDRADNDPEHLVPCHRSCHRKWHRLFEEKNRDIRSPEAKKFYGDTPFIFVSDRSRAGGTIRAAQPAPRKTKEEEDKLREVRSTIRRRNRK